MKIEQGLTFDDVLLIPKYSEIRHREDIDLSVKLSKNIAVQFPVMPANMKSISSIKLFLEFMKFGAITPLHRFCNLQEQLNFLQEIYQNEFYINKNIFNYFAFSIGVKKEDYENLPKLIKTGVKILIIDIAHGDSKACIEMISYISNRYPDIFLIAGNVATADGAERLWRAGADAVKAGIGASMVCTTRTVSGNGFPQLSMLDNCYQRKNIVKKQLNKEIFLIADGGCRIEADFVKSLCFADLVMAGGYFAGSDECPGEFIVENARKYKRYDGSSTLKNRVEGVRSLAKAKGSIKDLIIKIQKGLQSACSYQGVSNLADLKKDPQFVRVSSAGLIESYPHDILEVKN